mmetsp:Transcript_15918/g.24579  ORF Transcript_15918/g.24579 Transcript_15918/m.24579 type:complete len:146 (+) Transcript_15918:2083-2520(+)|eukprot:CAMPEP_0170507910 /NCGR_PEP_ID=MMETSP0208-20121228/60557_1 /TAXON_ID=197538 /ORGANISM="Strombidium inclinatum, Strain S3" /LENGTH=145 /DNA_ID=CAMNT_0010790461 /DNA_START=2047 /DNA_END=2484 /DNA_ORIENTATION=+
MIDEEEKQEEVSQIPQPKRPEVLPEIPVGQQLVKRPPPLQSLVLSAKQNKYIEQIPLTLRLPPGSEDQAIMSFLFLSKPDLLAYCVRTQGIYVTSFSEINQGVPPKSFLHFNNFTNKYVGNPAKNSKMEPRPSLEIFKVPEDEII